MLLTHTGVGDTLELASMLRTSHEQLEIKCMVSGHCALVLAACLVLKK